MKLTVHEKLLSDLIEIKSLSGEEGKLRDYIQAKFEEWGIESQVQGDNLVVHIRGTDSSKAFVFNSHMDTVGPGDQEWESDPWTATVDGDKIVGLGASDMKSGLAASMLLAQRYSQEKPPVDMWFTYVVMEEIDGSGTASFMEWFRETHLSEYDDVAAIFTEPTNVKGVEHGHRGNMFLRATAKGDSGHASTPENIEVHCVKSITAFSDALEGEVEKWKEEFPNEYFDPSITVGSMTTIQAGVIAVEGDHGEMKVTPESINKFPSRCTATFDIRTTHDFHPHALARITELGEKHGVEIELEFPDAPAGFTDPESKIVKACEKAVGEIVLTTTQGSADLGFFTAKGEIEAVIFGPGEKDQQHVTNEYCRPAQIPQAEKVYDSVVNTWAEMS